MLLSSSPSISLTSQWNVSGIQVLDIISQVVSSDALVVSFELHNGEGNQRTGPQVTSQHYCLR